MSIKILQLITVLYSNFYNVEHLLKNYELRDNFNLDKIINNKSRFTTNIDR